MENRQIVLKGVRVHNLKNVDLTLRANQLIVFTGVSGSGKSSLAYDTIYVEGQRRYIESLSTHVRRQMEEMPKPDAEKIEGISPTIAIEQKSVGKNPRSTVGTMTGIYDFLRVLFARVGEVHCPESGEKLKPESEESIARRIEALPEKAKLVFLAPYAKGKKSAFKEDIVELQKRGYLRARIDGTLVELSDELFIDGKVAHDLDLVTDRFTMNSIDRARLLEAISQTLEVGKGVMSVLIDGEEEILFSRFAHSQKSGKSYGPLEPHDFSFNHPAGMCPRCQGLGTTYDFAIDQIIDGEKSIAEDCCKIAGSYNTVRWGNIYNNLAKLYDFKVTTPWKNLSEQAKHAFLYGTEKKWTRMLFVHPTTKKRWVDFVQWRGILFEGRKRYEMAESDLYRNNMHKLMEIGTCPECLGAKIKPYPAASLIGGKKIHEITAMSIGAASLFFEALQFSKEEWIIAEELVKEIRKRLSFLNEVGLHYLALERTAPTLSGGEGQRVRLAAQIGAGLVGSTYILDEPSIGLHPRDNHKLLKTLRDLRDLGNTVIVIEHDEETICAADEVIDIGPGAGVEGGRVTFQGHPEALFKSSSLTGEYLSRKRAIEIPKKRRKKGKEKLLLKGATHHNLKSVNLQIPLGLFVAVTGVSGSGKSSLISQTLYPLLVNHLHHGKMAVGAYKKIEGIDLVDKVIAIDQTPIGRTPRSNPATYTKLFDEVRDLFSALPEAKAHGFSPGRFSFNVKEGSCPHCRGMGMVKIDMDFMEDAWKECLHCQGRRFDEKTLSIHYKGKSIYDVLEMSIDEAHLFFADHPSLSRKLQTLLDVGLDYMKVGQPSPTLSGGEAQRIKLAKELSRPSTGSTLYILDEPTTGLHFHDLNKLLAILHKLVSRGNTVLVIEHNMDLVKTVDHVIDLGPEGGDAGGTIVAEGTPEQVAKSPSPTAKALDHALQNRPYATYPKREQERLVHAITVQGAAQNNLKKVSATIPHGKITICSGPSGSGKSSFAFETVYAEGQRRYTETLSPYARQFVKQLPKPKVDGIDGLLAAIAIEQKVHAGNPRSTIGTMTETYDLLRLLFAHKGIPYCPESGEIIETISKERVVDSLLQLPEKTSLYILSKLSVSGQESFDKQIEKFQKEGYLRIRLNGTYFEMDEEIPFDPHKKNSLYLVIDRLRAAPSSRPRLLEAVEKGAAITEGMVTAATPDEDLFFNLAFAVQKTGKSYPKITPHSFSFNTEEGMCQSCLGLGYHYGANLAFHPDVQDLTIRELIALLWKEEGNRQALSLLEELLEKHEISPYSTICDLDDREKMVLFKGSDSKTGKMWKWRGIDTALEIAARVQKNKELLQLLTTHPCSECRGSRLNPLATHVELMGKKMHEVTALPLEELHPFLSLLPVEERSLLDVKEQLLHRLQFLLNIGLSYLSLDRRAPTLSGGETQRIRLSRALGSGLTGTLYVLDEPTIGLHPHNNTLLNRALKELAQSGNTLLLVEHDPMTVQIADQILDFGPEAGGRGGRLVAKGSYEEILHHPDSLTGAYLSGKKAIPLPKKRRAGKGALTIKGAKLHNLKNLSLTIPLQTLTAITGISGSGKSTLISTLLRKAVEQGVQTRRDSVSVFSTEVSGIDALAQMIALDQNPIGQTSRADISTYSDILTPLRSLYASMPKAKAKGLMPRHFSFNHKEGMCKTCYGLGTKTIEMQFLPPVKVPCEKCHGYRLNPLSLQVEFKGKHLGHVLEMTLLEAEEFFSAFPKIIRSLQALKDVGLSYLKLGQDVATLSGGEAQRLRLAKEIAKKTKGKTLYIFDEPTVGLHPDDIAKLLPIFHSLVDKGHTIFCIEHNIDLIASSDHIIDLGPDAGEKGGMIIAQGTPETIAACKESKTGKFLALSRSGI